MRLRLFLFTTVAVTHSAPFLLPDRLPFSMPTFLLYGTLFSVTNWIAIHIWAPQVKAICKHYTAKAWNRYQGI